ncbi:MAG: GMC family oxidoreductase [Gammaproteobacteria bacterium]|nr:GMC family oxidoreductase [Gammaproteobacteria bacterium]
MIVDLRDIDSDPFRDKTFDVCICGAGVAGITIARRLPKHLNVALLEAGGLVYTDESQAVYQGTSIGQDYFNLTATRLRFFGGTSNHWEGWCRPLDAYDFLSHEHVERSGWPIRHRDLEPYLTEAKSILNIPNEPTGRNANVGGEPQMLLAGFKEVEYWWSPPIRFGTKYGAEIESMAHVICYLNANVTDITLFENKSAVQQVQVRDYMGRTFNVKARQFVLAAGGIENPRILLNCNRQVSVGLGNDHGLVGRFFTEHPHYWGGGLMLEDRVKNELLTFRGRKHKQYDIWKIFGPTPKFMQREKVLSFNIRLELDKPRFLRPFRERIQELVCTTTWGERLAERMRGRDIDCRLEDGKLRIVSEQTPNPDSRVMLGSDTDRFAMKRVVLDWRLSEIDKHTLRRAVIRFGQMFAERAWGRVRVEDWLLEDNIELPRLNMRLGNPGHHHMCTTRMGSTARQGVVDANQRVFGISNLYVAGSSVFATGGSVSPTLTIVQTCLRLADHLPARLKTPP